MFQDAVDDYESIIGMQLMGDDGLLKEMPLCEIHDFEVQAGFRGKVTVSVTLRGVGRAKIQEYTQMKPVMMGTCTELVDNRNVNIEAANEIVDDIETTINDMDGTGRLKQRYDEAFKLALEADCQDYARNGDSSGKSREKRPMSVLTAASWAVFGCTSDKSNLYKAVATTDLCDRLELGLKSLLDQKYQASAPPNEVDEDVGFE